MAQREQDTREGTPTSIGDELAEAVRRQLDQVTEALRAEIARLQQDVSARGRAAAQGAGYVGAAGALGLVAGGALASLPLIALRKASPPTAIALSLPAVPRQVPFCGAQGLEQLKEAAPESVGQTHRRRAGGDRANSQGSDAAGAFSVAVWLR